MRSHAESRRRPALITSLRASLPLQFAQVADNGRDDLEEVADDAVVGDLEDRRLGVAVDGDDDVRVLHPD